MNKKTFRHRLYSPDCRQVGWVDVEFSGGMRFPEVVRAEIDGVPDKLECGRLQGSRDGYALEWFTSLGCRVFTHGIPWDIPSGNVRMNPVRIIVWKDPDSSDLWMYSADNEEFGGEYPTKEKALENAKERFGNVEVLYFKDYEDGAGNFDILRWFEEGCPVKTLS
jgi:hypothetical protein